MVVVGRRPRLSIMIGDGLSGILNENFSHEKSIKKYNTYFCKIVNPISEKNYTLTFQTGIVYVYGKFCRLQYSEIS